MTMTRVDLVGGGSEQDTGLWRAFLTTLLLGMPSTSPQLEPRVVLTWHHSLSLYTTTVQSAKDFPNIPKKNSIAIEMLNLVWHRPLRFLVNPWNNWWLRVSASSESISYLSCGPYYLCKNISLTETSIKTDIHNAVYPQCYPGLPKYKDPKSKGLPKFETMPTRGGELLYPLLNELTGQY